MKLVNVVYVFVCFIVGVCGFGRLIDPPGRSSAWRFGFHTPINYDDNALNCGGYARQINNGGKCGVCGDAWDGPRDNEAGGKYATGVLVKQYTVGQAIPVSIRITSSCLGWFEFRLCPNNNVSRPVTQDCLDRHLLKRADSSETRFLLNSTMPGLFSMTLKLPDGLACTQCVLQWKHRCGNNWGTDSITRKSCVGCGLQQEFINCADVEIRPNSTSDTTTRVSDGGSEATQGSSRQQKQCRAINNWAGQPGMDAWCTTHCAIGNCPELTCDCSPLTTPIMTTPTMTPPSTTTTQALISNSTGCRAINYWAGNDYLDKWCIDHCAKGDCPETSCKCGREAATTKQATPSIVTPATRTTFAPPTVVSQQKVCKAISIWKDIDVFDRWCTEECNNGNCPTDTCQCVNTPLVPLTVRTTPNLASVNTTRVCSSKGVLAGDYWNQWCQAQCDKNYCPIDYCNC